MEARFLKAELEQALGAPVFLDSDDLRDLTLLFEHVRESSCVVLLQSEAVLARPWCLAELVTAVDHHVPIVAVSVSDKGYDFAQAGQLPCRGGREERRGGSTPSLPLTSIPPPPQPNSLAG